MTPFDRATRNIADWRRFRLDTHLPATHVDLGFVDFGFKVPVMDAHHPYRLEHMYILTL